MKRFAGLACLTVLPVATVCLGLSAQAAGAVAPTLASHRAVYELSLFSSKGEKSPNMARGRIAFDFSGNACDGYTQNFRQLTELQPAEGPVRMSDMRSATFEDAGARNFRFKVESKVDNRGVEEIDGSASKSGDGALSVRLMRPRPSRLDLAQDVVFPTEHIMRIIQAAQAGQRTLSLKAFDGTDTGRKVFETLAIIGKEEVGAPAEKAAQAEQLKNMKRWPVTISYFETDKKDNTPNYVLSFDLYENGVSRALKLDYGDFVLAGEMKQLEFLPTKPCKQKK
ncbi:MAG: cell envelope integrity EipB family protein [Rhodoblastus sp.]